MTQARIAQLARGLQLIANETDGEDVRSPRVIVDMSNQALHELGRIVEEDHPKNMVKALLDEVITLLQKQIEGPQPGPRLGEILTDLRDELAK